MEKNDLKRFKNMMRLAFIIAIIAGIISFLITKNSIHFVSIMYGTVIGVLGFKWIIQMMEKIEFNEKTKRNVVINYLLRYLCYAILMIIGYQYGLNILTMLIGFVCMNLSIKIYTILEERGTLN